MATSKKRYIASGLLAIFIIATAYWGLNFLKGKDLLNPNKQFFAIYERIDGLDVASPITVNGYKIGQVTKIDLLPELNGKVLVSFETKKEYEIPDSSVAEIYSMDLMGTKGIQIIFSECKTNYKSGDTIASTIEQSLKDQVSMQMLPIKNQAEELMAEIQDAIKIINSIFNEDTRKNLEQSFESFRRTMSYLEGASFTIDTLLATERQRLARIITDIDIVTHALAQSSDDVTNLFSNLSSFSDTLMALEISQTISNANNVIRDISLITEKINNGEGSLGQLLNNDTLYYYLENTTLSLDKLLTDIRLNPRKYINFSVMSFGRTINVANEDELSPRDKRYLERQRKKNEREFNKKASKDNQSYIPPTIDVPSEFYLIELTSTSLKITDLTVFSEINPIIIESINGYHYFAYLHFDSQNTSNILNLVKPDFPNAKAVCVKHGEVIYL